VSSRIVISWKAFLLFSVVSILAVPLALVKQLSPQRFILFCGIGLLITALVGFFLLSLNLLLQSWIKNQSRIVHERISVLLIAVAGVIRGVLLYWAISISGFNQPTNFWTRVATSTTTTLLWLTSISIIVTSNQGFKADYEKLLRRAILSLSNKFEPANVDSLPKYLESNFAEIESLLNRAFGSDRPVESFESLAFAAAWIKNLIEQKIRPLSHRLWIESASTLPKVDLGSSVLSSIRYLNLPPLPVSIFLFLISVLNVSTSVGWQRGLLASVIISIETFFLLSFYKDKISDRSSGKLLFNVALLLIPGILLTSTFYFTNRFIFADDIGPLNLIYILIFLMVAIPASTFQLANRDREQLLLAIENELINMGWDRGYQERYLKQNAASYLHNLLQSELFALSQQINASDPLSDPKESRENLEELLKRLHRPIKQDFQSFLYDPIARLNRLSVAWKGIAEINISIPPEAFGNQNRNIVLVQLVEEAIANAVRHAGATRVWITARVLKNQQVKFSIVNDGSSTRANGDGMGSAWLDHHAPNAWNRVQTERGAELTITL
jgi:signal transduction histidine kinase